VPRNHTALRGFFIVLQNYHCADYELFNVFLTAPTAFFKELLLPVKVAFFSFQLNFSNEKKRKDVYRYFKPKEAPFPSSFNITCSYSTKHLFLIDF